VSQINGLKRMLAVARSYRLLTFVQILGVFFFLTFDRP
jgi:hypothetical protein